VSADLLGPARVSDDELADIVGVALGRPVQLADWRVTPVGYRSLTPSTGALVRVAGTTKDGADWSIFVKVLQHARHWAMLHMVPEPHRASFTEYFPWRGELAAWDSAFTGRLPDGLRTPRLYRLAELPDDRVAVWMEDVRPTDRPWDLDRYARAAWLLGAMAALSSAPDLLATSAMPTGYGLRMYWETRVVAGALPILDVDAAWAHPALDPTLRADLTTLKGRVPALLDRLDGLPQSYPHGDACPQNLLVPADAPDTLVAIDVWTPCRHAVGFDLGQLLVGLVYSGELPAAAVPAVHGVLVPGYVAGMAAHGVEADPADVAYGYAACLLARAGFTSIPFEEMDDPTLTDRVALTRFIADLGLALR
jgi:hypothetical protein